LRLPKLGASGTSGGSDSWINLCAKEAPSRSDTSHWSRATANERIYNKFIG
jgi:hypothetical protein